MNPATDTSFKNIRYEVKNGVAFCVLNRPDKLNSMSIEMGRELQCALAGARDDSNVRAVLLTGEGRGFCSGQDISDFAPKAGRAPETHDLGKIIAECCNPIVRTIRSMEKPVVCAVNGVAAGSGANLALCADIVIAAREASFVQAFSKIGLIPDFGGSYLLPRLIGLARATALAMLAEKLPAEAAQQMGLIYRVVEGAALMPEATSLAEKLATMPTRGLGLTKRALNASLANSLEQQLALEQELQRMAGHSADFQEGVSAFFEKRPPRFTGA